MKLINVIFLFLVTTSSFTNAATIGSAQILGERLDGKNCGLSNDATEAAIASVLRQNRISIRDSFDKIKFYYSITDLNVNNGCAVGINLQVFTWGDYLVPTSPPKKLFSKIELCGHSYLLTGPKYDLQSRVSDTIRTLVEMCINEISKQ